MGIKRTLPAAALGMVGLLIGYALFAYLELTSSHLGDRSGLLLALGNILCPPALLSSFLFDLDAHSVEAFIAWSIIAFLNAGLYVLLGKLLDKFVLRSERPTTT